MTQTPDPLRTKARIASFVIMITMVLWMAASWIGGSIGLETRYAFLFDFAALAALFWALVNLFQVWRDRQE